MDAIRTAAAAPPSRRLTKGPPCARSSSPRSPWPPPAPPTPPPVRAIVSIRGAGDYTELALDDGKRLLSPRPLKEWETRLPTSFARVHRTAIVNLDRVERVERTGDDCYRVILRGGEPAPMSRRHAARLRQLSP